jgi:hypothetical protein
MDEPVHRHLRTARGSGLTSPEPVTHPYRRHGPPTNPPDQDQGQAAETASGDIATPGQQPITRKRISSGAPYWAVDRG